MANATGEAKSGPLLLQFNRSVRLLFRGSAISSDGGLLLHRELDDALGLTDLATDLLVDHRTGKNGRHTFVGLSNHLCTKFSTNNGLLVKLFIQ